MITNNELLQELLVLAKYLGRIPTCRDMGSQNEVHSVTLYKKRFGSFNAALNIAGLANRQLITDEFLLSELLRFYDEFRRIPTANDLDTNKDYPSRGVYRNHFGHFENALKLLNLPTRYVRTSEESAQYKKEYRAEWYRQNPNYNKDYRFANYEKKLNTDAEYRRTHKVERAEYVAKNPDKFREYANRRSRNFGFRPLNKYFVGAHAHHLHINNSDDVIYIPSEIHQSVWHSHKDNDKMV